VICKYCKRECKRTANRQLYCSTKCREKNYRETNKAFLQVYDKVFRVYEDESLEVKRKHLWDVLATRPDIIVPQRAYDIARRRDTC